MGAAYTCPITSPEFYPGTRESQVALGSVTTMVTAGFLAACPALSQFLLPSFLPTPNQCSWSNSPNMLPALERYLEEP